MTVDDSQEKKVIDLAAKKRGRPRKECVEGDGSSKDLIITANWLAYIAAGVLPTPYYVRKLPEGTRLLYRQAGDDPGVIRPSKARELAGDIAKTGVEKFYGTPDALPLKKALEVAAHYLAVAEPLAADPAPLLWQGENGLGYSRLPWARRTEPVAIDACPTWNGLLARMSNVPAFCAFIGSLFEPAAQHQMYCWVFGEGQDGKGAMNRFFARVFGPAYAGRSAPPSSGARFWTKGLAGKSLVAFPDCTNSNFITSGLFKSLTGGDPVEVEPKGADSYTETFHARYIFFANVLPAVSSAKSDQRRLILCRFAPQDIRAEPGFEDRLMAEGGDFLAACIDEYRVACPDHGAIPLDDAAQEDVANLGSNNENDFEALLEREFELDFSPEAQPGWVSGPALWSVLNESWVRNEKRRKEFITWLQRKHNVSIFRPHGGTRPRLYRGLCRKAAVDRC